MCALACSRKLVIVPRRIVIKSRQSNVYRCLLVRPGLRRKMLRRLELLTDTLRAGPTRPPPRHVPKDPPFYRD